MYGQFVGTFIHADDVTLLAPTSTTLNVMLETWFNLQAILICNLTVQLYVCIFDKKHKYDNIQFMNTPIELSSDIRCAYLKRYYQYKFYR